MQSSAGKEPPTACSSFPQTDADIPEKPYANYKEDEDFSALIAKQEEEKKQQQQQLQNPEAGSEKPPSTLSFLEALPAWARFSLILVPLLVIVGVAIYTFAMPRKDDQGGEHV
jgi:hypothetical protein